MMTGEEAAKEGIVAIGDSVTLPEIPCPVVKFVPNEHATITAPERVWVPVMTSRIENPNKTLLAERRQLPLMLAW